MYSVDLRKVVAARFKLSRDTVFRWTKTLEPKILRIKPATKIDSQHLKRVPRQLSL